MKKLAAFCIFLIPILSFSQGQYNLNCDIKGFFLNMPDTTTSVNFSMSLNQVSTIEAQEFLQGMKIMIFASLLEENKIMIQTNILEPDVVKAPIADFMNIYRLSLSGNDEFYFQIELNEINYSYSLNCAVNSTWSGVQ